ncbi:Glycosyltransferase involved in cell wall bisynthesis [Marininema mesophilum]|uniref:Glycosyltransferase involved in cell wall bisynthesis n=1 Tax=Marininema mesophilum TaxID=1048340 RepID=A0A1H3BI88_9BACL|nr:glycosyltransferase [Marininema mesophilum]SDX41680.1 Glycosyltransferase involved in cell wall bisynthesis [Marininema mesophilum]
MSESIHLFAPDFSLKEETPIDRLGTYAFDLAHLIQEMGWGVEIHRMKEQEEERMIQGILLRDHSINVAKKAEGACIFLDFLSFSGWVRQGSLGVIQGMQWIREGETQEEKHKRAENVQQGLNQLYKLIVTDSYLLTYCRSVCTFPYNRVHFIPDGLNGEFYHSNPKEREERSSVNIWMPLSTEDKQGFLLSIEIADWLLEHHPTVKVCFTQPSSVNRELLWIYQRWQSHHLASERIETVDFGCALMRRDQLWTTDILIHPHFNDTDSIDICLEALACGVPIIASSFGRVNDWIIDSYNGYLTSPTLENVTQSALLLLDDPVRREVIGRRGRETVLRRGIQKWRENWRSTLQKWKMGGDYS